jgi:hypothetical protein
MSYVLFMFCILIRVTIASKTSAITEIPLTHNTPTAPLKMPNLFYPLTASSGAVAPRHQNQLLRRQQDLEVIHPKNEKQKTNIYIYIYIYIAKHLWIHKEEVPTLQADCFNWSAFYIIL